MAWPNCKKVDLWQLIPGTKPHDRGHVGRVIGPYIGVLVGLKGDEKFIQRTLKLIASPISDEVCMYCKASQSGTNIYALHGAGAPHRSTLVSNEQFFTTGCHSNSWLRLPGFHISRVFLDWLHLVDLALIPECSASVPWHSPQSCLYGGVLLSGVKVSSCHDLNLWSKALIELTSTNQIWKGDSRDERLRLAFVQFTAQCKQHRVSAKVAHLSCYKPSFEMYFVRLALHLNKKCGSRKQGAMLRCASWLRKLQNITSQSLSKHCPTVWTTQVWLTSIWQLVQGNNYTHRERAIFRHWFKSTSMGRSLGLLSEWMWQLYNCWCYRYPAAWYRGSRSTGNLAERCLSCCCFAEPWRYSCCASWQFIS